MFSNPVSQIHSGWGGLFGLAYSAHMDVMHSVLLLACQFWLCGLGHWVSVMGELCSPLDSWHCFSQFPIFGKFISSGTKFD
jgi:hypothetical protein